MVHPSKLGKLLRAVRDSSDSVGGLEYSPEILSPELSAKVISIPEHARLISSAGTEYVFPRNLLRIIDNTALTNYMVCPRKYHLSMNLSIGPSTGKKPPAIVYGVAWHAGQDAWIRTNGDLAAAHRAIVMNWEDHGRVDDYRTVQRCMSAIEKYGELYGKPQNSFERTLGWPDNAAVELATNALIPGAIYAYAGRIDHVYQDLQDGEFYVEDHKSTSRLGDNFFQQFVLNNQMMGYAVLASFLTAKPIKGVRINAHGILKSEDRFKRLVIPFSDERLTEWLNNLNMWIVQLQWAYDNNHWPAAWNSCHGKYGACKFFDLCATRPSLRAAIVEADYAKDEWNPLTIGPLDEFTEH